MLCGRHAKNFTVRMSLCVRVSKFEGSKGTPQRCNTALRGSLIPISAGSLDGE